MSGGCHLFHLLGSTPVRLPYHPVQGRLRLLRQETFVLVGKSALSRHLCLCQGRLEAVLRWLYLDVHGLVRFARGQCLCLRRLDAKGLLSRARSRRLLLGLRLAGSALGVVRDDQRVAASQSAV